jgi:hypothetical protein
VSGDLELFLRGLFVNRWRCRHPEVVELALSFDHVRSFRCVDCGCVASISEAEILTRHLPRIRDLEFVRP